jgi:uncharacterized protein YndB with AHSA1/START domain
MPRAEAQVTIARPAADVFDFLADGANNLSWRPGVLDIQHVSGEGLGAVWRQGVRGPGGSRIAADYQITEFDRPVRFAFRAIAGPARPEGRYELRAAEGATVVSFALWWEPTGLAKLLASPVQKTMDAEVAQLAKLKSELEQG